MTPRRGSPFALGALSVAAAASIVGAAGVARADGEATDLEGLLDEPVLTTASKTAETASAAPATSTVITAEDIRRWGIHTVDEAINFLSLGAMSSDPLTSPEVGARGVLLSNDRGDHFLLLVDGHAVNEPLFGSAQYGRGLGVPIELVDHIEVILGPGSVLYGSNAMLGVINVVTRRAKDLTGAHAWAETEVAKSYRVGAAGSETTTLLGKPFEVTVGAEYYTSSGPNFTYGPQNFGLDDASGAPSRFTHDDKNPNGIWGGKATRAQYARAPSATLHLGWGDFDVSVRGATFKRAIPYRARYASNAQDFDDPDSYQLDRNLSVDVAHHAALSPVVQLRTRLYGDSFDNQVFLDSSEASGCLFVNVGTCRYHATGISRWLGAEVQSSFDWRKDSSVVTLVGVDGRVRQVGFKIDATDYDTGRTLSPTQSRFAATERLLGAYLQQTWQPVRALALNGGVRLDLDERFARQLSPRLAASLKTWTGGTFKTIYSEAFRSPSWTESNLTGITQLPATGLRPERVRSIETSLDHEFGAQRLHFGLFRSWWTDLVELHVLTQAEGDQAVRDGAVGAFIGGLAQFRNVARIDNYGLDASFEGALEGRAIRYGLDVTSAYARRHDAQGTTPLVVAPQLFGNARVAWDLPGDLPAIGLAVHWMGRRLADRALDGGFTPTPTAPPFAELRATVGGPVPSVTGLSYRLSANYAFAARGPYVVGPYQANYLGNQPRPELVPIDRFRVTIGLQYDFLVPGDPVVPAASPAPGGGS